MAKNLVQIKYNTSTLTIKSSAMKPVLPCLSLLLLTIIFASCTTAYKTGQTPDDVYFSPERPQEEYVRVEQKDDRAYRYDDRRSRYDDEYYDDRYLRMRVRNRRLWSDLDFYYSDPFAYNYFYNRYNRYNYYNNYYGNTYANPYTFWNHYYNPYYSPVIVVNPKSPVYNKPRTTNLHVFDAPQTNSANPKTGRTRTFNSAYDNQPDYNAPRRNTGSDLRNIFGGSSNNNSSTSNSAPTRSVDNSGSRNSSSGSNNSSGSRGGNAPVRRF